MTTFQHAEELDISAAADAFNIQQIPPETLPAKISAAANAYEDVLKQQELILDAYLNLGFLYWQSTEFGFHASIGLDLGFVKFAEERYPQILQAVEHNFPENPEVQFWKLYFGFVMGDPPFVDRCKMLVGRPGCSLVPFFFLYSQADGHHYGDEAMKLLEQCQKVPTLKNCYIKSVIDGVKARQT